jgi:hypothetical protein
MEMKNVVVWVQNKVINPRSGSRIEVANFNSLRSIKDIVDWVQNKVRSVRE